MSKKKLYRVRFIRQDNGEEQTHYVLAESIALIEREYADIEAIKPLLHQEIES